jgi:hypothetical protein
MKDTCYMSVIIDFVLFLVNYASDHAAGATYMAWPLTKPIFAGLFAISLSGTSFISAF